MTHKNSGFKLIALLLMISLLVTGCALLPTAISDVANGPVYSGDTVTISIEEYQQLLKYAELEEIRQVVNEYYYQEPDEEALMDGAAMGMLYGLEDPYTFFYDPEAFAELWEEDEGDYVGIGIQIMADYSTGLCTITRVFTDSPALEVGMLRGDVLTRVEDIYVTATNLQEAVDIMRGEAGKPVSITVLRDGQFIDLVVTRAAVHTTWVNSCMLDEQVGYISLYEFSGDCSPKFSIQMDNLLAQGARALVIDLRDNPGGWVDDAQRIADFFLPEGTLATLKYRDGTEEVYSLTTDGKEVDIPLVVLVNEFSASASEILSGALQDYDRATIVGTQSYGKGVVQYVLPVGSRGAGMQLTVAQYFTAKGNEVHKVGITPDVIAEWPEDDNTMYQLGDLADAQLKVAYEEALKLLGE